jgi:hypothetical protein
MSISSKIALAMSANGASFEEVHNSLEKIADEFAIGFVEWLLNEWVNDERWSIITNIKELLEIYKRENNL